MGRHKKDTIKRSVMFDKDVDEAICSNHYRKQGDRSKIVNDAVRLWLNQKPQTVDVIDKSKKEVR